MRRDEIERVHDDVKKSIRKKNLRGVKIPELYAKDEKKKYTIGGLMLVFFAARMGQIATKEELIQFLRLHRCASNDPQPRHMGMQMGLNFLVNGCFHPKLQRELRRGEYCLLDLRKAHPARDMMHRAKGIGGDFSFDAMKRSYDMRCACCGSRENEKHFKNALLVTRLERGHCDPSRPLSASNCIPMCNMCNMVYKNNAVLNARGFVVQWNRKNARSAAEEDEPSSSYSSSSSLRQVATQTPSYSSSLSSVDDNSQPSSSVNDDPPEPSSSSSFVGKMYKSFLDICDFLFVSSWEMDLVVLHSRTRRC